ncbi:DMT family transporter [Aliikangiella marina]|uniref:DMT family transporter n=1 Tax=Aliikangiella marina TaxID=1712262 RepID=A0A545TDB6_9GAMM|nr:DMT family transporter [Aliikangiella marina]TQV75205.1 DMT family transporter [Aliikangiella marina]
MKSRDLFDLVLLAALWGASFLFMRVTVAEFGAIPLIAVRVALAAVFLLPFVFWRNRQKQIIENVLTISVVGILNSAIPFSLIAFSTLYLTAGFASILNAATPMFTAIIGFIWLSQRLSKSAIVGLFIGLIGVILLVWDKVGFADRNITIAVSAGLLAAVCYAIAANYSKKYLVGINPLALSAGSLVGASLFLMPMAIYFWPQQMPSLNSWINLIILAIACTGFAYILYFRLIERTGPANATTVTFLMPLFGMFWGWMFLDETISIETLIACGVILFGTGLTTGIVKTKSQQKET